MTGRNSRMRKMEIALELLEYTANLICNLFLNRRSFLRVGWPSRHRPCLPALTMSAARSMRCGPQAISGCLSDCRMGCAVRTIALIIYKTSTRLGVTACCDSLLYDLDSEHEACNDHSRYCPEPHQACSSHRVSRRCLTMTSPPKFENEKMVGLPSKLAISLLVP